MQVMNNYGVAAEHIATINIGAPPGPTLDQQVAAYYSRIADECAIATSHAFHPAGADATPGTSHIAEVYVEPDVILRPMDADAPKTLSKMGALRTGDKDRQPWNACFASDEVRLQRLVLVADGGMGKTTAVDVQVQRLAEAGTVPWLVLRLPRVWGVMAENNNAETLVEAALRRDIAQKLSLDSDDTGTSKPHKIAGEMMVKLQAQPGFLLFDALDEVPQTDRQGVLVGVLRFLANLSKRQANHKVLITSRSYAVADAEIQNTLRLAKFESLQLAPFTVDQQSELIQKYFSVENRDAKVGRALLEQIRALRRTDKMGLNELMQEPMLMTYVCMLAEQRGTTPLDWPLPTTRHELLDGVVELLLEKWDVKRRDSEQTTPFACLFERDPAVDPDRSCLRYLLERAALREYLHKADQKPGNRASSQLLPGLRENESSDRLFEILFSGKPNEALTADWLIARIDRALSANAQVRAHQVADWLTKRSGLMRSELRFGSEEPLMQHRQLADFLAAGALGQGKSLSDHAKALVEQAWFSPDWSRQMIALGFERIVVASKRAGKAPDTSALREGLAYWQAWCARMHPEDTALMTAVFAQALAQVIPADWIKNDAALDRDLNPLRERLVAILAEQSLSAAERAAAGDALGTLGDPRFAPGLWLPKERFGHSTEAEEPLPGFVRVAAGKFWMGAKDFKDNPPKDALIERDFYIARCPTTVAQYARFMAAEGYGRLGIETWGEAGLAWRAGEKRTQPRGWEEQARFVNRPVSGVSWWEARAYARWLNSDPEWQAWQAQSPRWLGYEAALPTERQWERAARCDERGEAHCFPWPWGESDDAAQRANVSESGVNRVSAVGCFAPNPFGVWDLSGNVWEWMGNAYQDPAHTAQTLLPEREKQLGEKLHPALRGGSWLDPADFARASVRSRDPPDDWRYFMGFRVVLSLANLNSDT